MISFYFQNFVIAPPVSLADQTGNAANTVTNNAANLVATGISMGDWWVSSVPLRVGFH